MASNDVLAPIRQRRSRLENLVWQLNALEDSCGELRCMISDHKAFSLALEESKMDVLQRDAKRIAVRITDQENFKSRLANDLQTIEAAKAHPIAVWSYFTSEQRRLRSEASNISSSLLATYRDLSVNRQKTLEIQKRNRQSGSGHRKPFKF